MRCQDVTRELAVPTGKVDPVALAAHLESCPACAAEAARCERLDQIWTATRPAEPPAGAFEASWAAVCRQMDAPAAAASSSRHVSARTWRFMQVGSGLAAAAALVLTGLIMFERGKVEQGREIPIVHQQSPQPQVDAPKPALADAQSAPRSRRFVPVPASDGKLMIVDLDELDVDPLAPRGGSNVVAADFELLDYFEALGQ